MHFSYVVIVVVCCYINLHRCSRKSHLRQDSAVGEKEEKKSQLGDANDPAVEAEQAEAAENEGETEAASKESSAEADTTPIDQHTFVALIDIVFSDASKRTCTGAVVHDNVVLTAAHCFIDRHNEYLTPELTFSFVVIGTKKMFEAGYEQYLPIEKVMSHPKFKGWTADLAMVFTFAGMTSDKPGQVIPLAGGRSSTPVDSNVTVLSWGRCANHNSLRESFHRESDDSRNRDDIEERGHDTDRDDGDGKLYNIRYMAKVEQRSKDVIEKKQVRPAAKTTERISRYLTSSEGVGSEESAKVMKNIEINPTDTSIENINSDMAYFHIDTIPKKKTNIRSKSGNHTKSARINKKKNEYLTSYKNWRRVMGKQKNELTVEVFGFVNVLACKKIVERTMPSVYSIKNHNEILCYSSEDHYITNEDAGAPALQNGHLVAVTVGGVETDGEHIAIGMKMSCFCNWIAENLPDSGGDKMLCCKNCCDTKHLDGDAKQKHSYLRHGIGRNAPVRFAEMDDSDDSESEPIPQQTTSKVQSTISDYQGFLTGFF